MPKCSPEKTEARREEIIDACERLYQTKYFNDISLSEIGAETTFTRTSIYNYFSTKEEVFLGLLQREYARWIVDLEKIPQENETLTAESLADKLSQTLTERKQLLKLLSMSLFAIEDNSRLENLVSFKQTYLAAMNALDKCLKTFNPHITPKESEVFMLAFFPFMYGIYPYVYHTDKQLEAMNQVGIAYSDRSIYSIAYPCILKLLKVSPPNV